MFAAVVPEPLGWQRPRDGDSAPRRVLRHLRTRSLVATYVAGFCLMGAFATVYNYLGFRVIGEPFDVPVGIVSVLFLAFLFGTAASRFSGEASRRRGAVPVIAAGVALVLVSMPLLMAPWLIVVVVGLVIFTIGIFLAHPVGSALSGRLPTSGRAQSTALYQLSWLSGTAVLGWLCGHVYAGAGWAATLGVVAALATTALGAILVGRVDAPGTAHDNGGSPGRSG